MDTVVNPAVDVRDQPVTGDTAPEEYQIPDFNAVMALSRFYIDKNRGIYLELAK